MKNFYICLLIIAVSMQVFAGGQITGKSLKFDSSNNDFSERLDALERENQLLVGKIEIIEHNVTKLEKVLTLIQQGNILNQQDVLPQKNNFIEQNSAEDIFAVVATKEQPQKILSDDIGKNIEKDKQSYDLALATLKDNKLVEAEEKFANFLKTYPKSPLLANAYFWYAESFFKRNLFDKAAINYLKSYKQSAKGAKASDSLLKLGLSLGELKKNQEACAIFDKLESEFPSRAASSIKRAKDAKNKFGCK